MFSIVSKTLPALISWGFLIYVIFQIPYPESLTKASTYQLLSFFIPFFLALTFTVNILLKSIIRSILITFGVITFLVLKALDALNIVSAGLTIIAVGLLISYFKTPKSKTGPFSDIPKINKLQKRR